MPGLEFQPIDIVDHNFRKAAIAMAVVNRLTTITSRVVSISCLFCTITGQSCILLRSILLLPVVLSASESYLSGTRFPTCLYFVTHPEVQ
jgi:hypothetical protein